MHRHGHRPPDPDARSPIPDPACPSCFVPLSGPYILQSAMASETSLCSESFVLCAAIPFCCCFSTVILGPNHCICINKCDKAPPSRPPPLHICRFVVVPHFVALLVLVLALIHRIPRHDIRCVGAAIPPDGEYIKNSDLDSYSDCDCDWSHRSAKLIFWFWACRWFSALWARFIAGA